MEVGRNQSTGSTVALRVGKQAAETPAGHPTLNNRLQHSMPLSDEFARLAAEVHALLCA
jgi:hypothetical protein